MAIRTPVIAGNWKMNTDVVSGLELAREILEQSDGITGVEKIVCPPFVALAGISELLGGSSVHVGAQNVSANENGAYTGEISTSMLEGLVSHVIVGHSERRALYNETSADVAAKAAAVVSAGLIPILCVGEALEIRQAGNAISFVADQLESSLAGYTAWESLIVAYEPVWAIGTGEAATSEQAQEMTAVCREVIRKLAPNAADSVRVLYGGSVNSGNIDELLEQPDIDGALVGGASLKADEFSKLITAAGSA
ncbi:MAG: triose-phosphate isomerase [Chloroflexi bacterium]|nr:triose-phosphate isomerase [Chloroflexota bacterium]MCH8116352.1 triose-phosphate isomerase [Chloroflexota bacterium]MCI0775285.1 triose-phosphate isomerase [Chloroflexota bacterium]MCI0804135.1 triose-phosphate isomerase [Chloroflexota bacterium]MCI0809183.1 triose-phosphate isomerase [Chloroflexota bacterium]